MLDAYVDQRIRCSADFSKQPTYQTRQEPIWLPAGLLAALLTLTLAISAVGAPTANHHIRETTPARLTPAKLQWRPVSRRPAATNDRAVIRDTRVRPTAFGDDSFGASSGRASVQGIVEVDSGSFGSASFDSASFDADVQVAQASEPDFGTELEQALSEPFGAEELPPQQEGDMIEPGPGMEDESMDQGADPFEGQDLPDLDPMPEIEEPTPAEPDTLELPPLDPSPSDRTAPRNGGAREPNTFPTEIEPLKVPPREDRGGADRAQKDDKQDQARQKAQKDCADELAKLKASRLSSIDIQIGVTGEVGKDYPYVCSIEDGSPFPGRCWPQVTYMWKASALCHKPLYFEQTHLERYGHSWGPYLDPLVSGAHFFTRFPVLPYCMGLKAPTECVYTLGHYRPGSCAPYMIEQPGVTRRAVLFEAGAWVGGIFALP